MMWDRTALDVFVGLDVGKTTHHAVALDRDGTVLCDATVPNDEMPLRALLTDLADHGAVVLVVDQPTSIGALPVAVAQAAGVPVGYVPGFTMRRIADTFPGSAKTDRRDARIIAEAARTMPHTVRDVAVPEVTVAEVAALAGHDADLVRSHTALTNQLRDLLTQLHPALERVVGPRLDRHGVLELLTAHPTPAQVSALGQTGIAAALRAHGSRIADRLAAELAAALAAQEVVLASTAAAAAIVPYLATQLIAIRTQRQAVGQQMETLLADHPLFGVARSLPGMGVKSVTTVIVETAGKTFASAAHLAAYAGLAPVDWRSGTAIRGTKPPRGNRRLKDALYQAAFASLKHAPSRAYYDRKRAEGKHHTQAVLALARRRCDVLFAMLRDGTPYREPAPQAA